MSASRLRPVSVLLLIALAALALAPSVAAKAKGFKYGVAAGEVGTKTAILWAKATKKGETFPQIVSRGGLGKCVFDDTIGGSVVLAKSPTT